MLGLDGSPDRGQLGTLLEGRNPETGTPLPGGRGRRPTNAGFDLTFTAPKSVSVLLAVGDERVQAAILDAQEKAARAGLDYLERHECFARRGRDGVDVIPAEGFVGGIYMHEMSRSGDPHLHTHVVIANRVRAADGRWTAPDMRPVYAAAKTAGTIAEAVLRHELTRSLGVHWHEVRNGTAEIDGMPRDVLAHFSRRHAEIRELAVARGWITERGVAEIQRETRDHKPILDRDVAQAQWRARAAEHGLGRREVAAVLQPLSRGPVIDTGVVRDHLVGPSGLTRQESTFDRRALIRGLAEGYPDGIAADTLERRADDILAHDAVRVSTASGHLPSRFTTFDMLATERRLLDVGMGKIDGLPTVAERNVDAAIASIRSLGPDQEHAVRYLTFGTERTRLLEARAGYGKTTALRAVRDAYEREGVPVLGTSWQGAAAQALEREAGIRSDTTARILDQLARGRQPIPDGAVVVVDEAGMMPTRALAELVNEVAACGGRLILVGDRDQLPSIDAGGAFASLADRLGVAQLAENRRQRDALQRAVATHLANGESREALALLSEHQRFRTYDDTQIARKDLIDDWASTSLHHPHRALILAHDRRDVLTLNHLARQRLDEAGLLGDRRLEAHGKEWAVGDRLVCRRNNYTPGIDVRNGTRASVIGVDTIRQMLRIRTDDGRTVQLPTDYLSHVDHGYAVTGHASQGATVDRTYLLATPGRGGREWGYVAGSRHRIDLRVYAVHHDQETAREELIRTWSRSQAKTLAMDRLEPPVRDRAMREADRRRQTHIERTPPSPADIPPTIRDRLAKERAELARRQAARDAEQRRPQERERDDERDRGRDDDDDDDRSR